MITPTTFATYTCTVSIFNSWRWLFYSKALIVIFLSVAIATIRDKTTWESFPHHVHFPTQQNYFQNDAFTERKPLFNVASHKRPEIRLSFEYTTTLLSGEGGEGRTGTATMFRKMLSKYTIFSTVLSKIVALQMPRTQKNYVHSNS